VRKGVISSQLRRKKQILVAEAFYLDMEQVTVSSKVVAMEYLVSKTALIIIK
jgi:hypothetical protein